MSIFMEIINASLSDVQWVETHPRAVGDEGVEPPSNKSIKADSPQAIHSSISINEHYQKNTRFTKM